MFFSAQLITIIILITLVGSYLIGLAADLLNINNISPDLPEEFKYHYDPAKYAKSQAYLKETTRFAVITETFDLIIILIFWFLKGFQYIDAWVRSFELPGVISGIFFIGILMFFKLLLSIPFSLYSTFIIEEKYGFNKSTIKLFFLDLLKSVVLSGILGSMLIALILLFLEYGGPSAWLMCWGASTFFLMAVQYIVPTWIMPLFNKFSPLEDGELKQAIMEYAEGINFSLSNIFVMDGSKRSSKANAFFAGFGKNKRIVLYDTLIEEHSTDELLSILAHEMGHFKKKHIIKRIAAAVVQMGIIFYLLSIFISHEALFQAFFMENQSIYAGLVFFGMLYSPIDFFVSILFQHISRKDEYEADRFAVQSLQNSQSLISALIKLSVSNLSNLVPHPFYVFLNYSHPPVLERIRTLNAL